MASVRSNSIVSLKEVPFSRRSNKDKLATKHLGPPRPNLNIKQVSTKGGKSYNQGFSRSWYERKTWLAGCEAANALFCYTCTLFHPDTCIICLKSATGATLRGTPLSSNTAEGSASGHVTIDEDDDDEEKDDGQKKERGGKAKGKDSKGKSKKKFVGKQQKEAKEKLKPLRDFLMDPKESFKDLSELLAKCNLTHQQYQGYVDALIYGMVSLSTTKTPAVPPRGHTRKLGTSRSQAKLQGISEQQWAPETQHTGPPLRGQALVLVNHCPSYGEKQSDLQYVNDYRPQIEGRQLRILLHGPVGAGKSSFINSIKCVLQGTISAPALVDNDSLNKKYTTYKIEKGSPSTVYPFVFSEIINLSKTNVDDIKLALMGRVNDDYTSNPEQKLSEGDQFYKTVNPNDEVHVLVSVISADTQNQIRDEVIRKTQEIRKAASEIDIPQMAIITKLDEACPKIKEDLKNIYKSTTLKEQMEQFSADVGIPMNCIFPVKNYSEGIVMNDDVDSVILSTLRHIIDFGEESMNHKMSQSKHSYRYD
ncbi:interferon-induced protein 44-like [Scomber scombrus]|uniref:Interferon-induced protein 44-like n=1 Tax=Scomber scombrus TaxID=13677 RepID=A0AAV1PZX9_SCOSC